MKYTKIKWKYKIDETCTFQTQIKPDTLISTEWITLTPSGLLTLQAGYAWDGASGAVDTKSFMRGSAVHDALFQLIRLGLLDKQWFKECNKEMIRWCDTDGMLKIRQIWVYHAVRLFGKKHIRIGKSTSNEIV
jgi:hypothetical protein